MDGVLIEYMEKSEKVIKEFTCIPRILVYNTTNSKIYGAEIDTIKYPDLKLNMYNNISLLGNIHELGLGIFYKVKAEEKLDKKGRGYGYHIIHIQRERPTNEHTTRMFLSEILTYDQVKTIMENYPDIVDRVINNRLDDIDLKKLYNIGQFRFNIIRQKIEENFVFAELIEMFQGLIDMRTIKKMYDKYPSSQKIKEEIQREPYKSLCSLSKIGFKNADSIILELDKESKLKKQKGEKPLIYFDFDVKTSVQRVISAIEYLLEENENNGHTKIGISLIRKSLDKLVPECSDKLLDAIKNSNIFHINREDKTISFLETYETELYIANEIIEGLKIKNKWNIDTEEHRKVSNDINLTEQQHQTLNMLCQSNICILNGFSGSGKSQTTNAIIEMLKDNNKSFCLFAPTGRAAKVLAEYAKEPASTIHRGLAYMPPEWGYNEKCKLPYDVIIIDEFGMCDVFLTKHILEAIDFSKTKLLMIGDSAQIPSINAGNVFYDLINSNIIPIVSLTQIFRYGEGGILTVATKTRNSEIFLTNSLKPQIFGEDKSYVFVHTPQEKVINSVIKIYNKLLHKGYLKEDVMVLSTYNIGDYGTLILNKHLQPISNDNVDKQEKYIQIGDIKFYENDMIIQTVNNYKAIKYNEEYINEDDEIFVANGEIGTIIKIEYNKIIIQFDEIVIYDKNDLINIKLAYSIGTIKSQGGQAKIVIMITPKAHTYMLNSNLIYVAQTRAKQKVFHLGEIETVNRAIKKKADFNRKTYLKDILINKGVNSENK